MGARPVHFTSIVFWTILTTSANARAADETTSATTTVVPEETVISEAWLRFDGDFEIYNNQNNGLRLAPLISVLGSYARPGDGASLSAISGFQIGDRNVDFAVLGGINLVSSTGSPRGILGMRSTIRLPGHTTVWHETLFSGWTGGQRVMSQIEAVHALGALGQIELGAKLLIEGNPIKPSEEMVVLAGPLLQAWITEQQSKSTYSNWIPRIRLDIAFKFGGLWRGNTLYFGQQIEAELVFFWRTTKKRGTATHHGS